MIGRERIERFALVRPERPLGHEREDEFGGGCLAGTLLHLLPIGVDRHAIAGNSGGWFILKLYRVHNPHHVSDWYIY